MRTCKLNFPEMAVQSARVGRLFLCILWASLVCVGLGRAQERQTNSRQISELGRENLSRAAASATDLKAILIKDAGLMVELKRWIAKDATGHGQIISDNDLTDEAIFDRLEMDVQFRSTATLLVQRYGYLVPKLNPESEAAKERELLVQERTKWLAQAQEQERTMASQRRMGKVRNAANCESQFDEECYEQRPTDEQSPEIRRQQENLPPSNLNPNEFGAPVRPRSDSSQVLRAQYGQYDEDMDELGGGLSQLPLGSLSEAASSLSLSNGGSSDATTLRASLSEDGQGRSLMSMANNGDRNVVDALATYGVGAGRPDSDFSELSRLSPDANALMPNASSSRYLGSSSNTPSSINSMPLYERRRRPKPVPPSPELVRAVSPYNDIPSLYDMYIQAVPRPAIPRRFGIEVFQNGTRDSQLIPMDLPAGPDYVIGPGDGLSINLWGGPTTQRLNRVVDREGRVNLPEVGPILVSGKSLADVQESVQKLLRTEFRRVSADVSLSRLRTIRIYEVGDIAEPGAYDVSSLSTPLNALFVAGGPTQKGSLRIVKHYRGGQLVEVVDLYDLLLHGVKSNMGRLENGDTVLVPTIGPQVTVEGMVRRPAIYELKDEKNLASVLELAGGLLPTATLRHIEVQRLTAHEKQTMLSFDLPEVDSDAEVTKKLEAFEIHDGDRIRVFPIAPYNQDAVYLEGHVTRPGRYSYRQDMHLTDIVASYKDLLPEPSNQYAEIIRLNAPDFHPSVESFNLTDALASPAKSPVLHAMDTVRIFSRFDFENPPSVSVWGNVRNPGTYRSSGEIRLSDAVHLAGGLTPDAKTEDAQVFRSLP